MDGILFEKLTVLGEGAKYDVSCSSSGHARLNVGRIGSAACAGICHTWTADGRCMSLLKVLMSNDCAYDCAYCVNRRTAEVKRCTFEPRELADVTMEFYRRNYIEGLFLSSAVVGSPDATVERMYEVLWLLREAHGFAGYIHAKVIPGVSPELLLQLGLVADRLSVNIELPSEGSLAQLAPQKKPKAIFAPMRQITATQMEHRTLKAAGTMKRMRPEGLSVQAGDGCLDDIRDGMGGAGGDGAGHAHGGTDGHVGANALPANAGRPALPERRRSYKEKFAPAGQTTQLIVGASPESDREIVALSEALYRRYSMKRVYFSAYIPVAASPYLPPLLTPPPLAREHRLYQADWLLRFYGFSANEILPADAPNLDTELDPKAAWALRHLDMFPVEVNRASEEELLRVPGIGSTSVYRIMRQRRVGKVGYDDLKKMGVVLKRARFFITCAGKYYGDSVHEPTYIRGRMLDGIQIRGALGGGEKAQVSMFDMQAQALGGGYGHGLVGKVASDGAERQAGAFGHELSV